MLMAVVTRSVITSFPAKKHTPTKGTNEQLDQKIFAGKNKQSEQQAELFNENL